MDDLLQEPFDRLRANGRRGFTWVNFPFWLNLTLFRLNLTPFGLNLTPFGLNLTPFGLSLSKPSRYPGTRQILNPLPIPGHQRLLLGP